MKESFYFPHDNNAHNDPKLMTVFMKTWLSWIWLYWIIIEIMHQQESWKIKKEQYDDCIRWYTMNENKWSALVENLLNIYLTSELFCLDDEWYVYSKRVLDNKKYREELIEKRSEAWKKSALARQKSTSVEQVLNKCWTRKGNKRKGKEIKGKEIKTDTVSLQLNEYQESISFLKKIDIDNIEFPDYAIENKKYWIEFILYWTEKWNNWKIRAEWEKTFEIKRRFYNWLSRAKVQYEKPKQTFNSIW